jgi:predicted  nucleic acid-binding Zn-ribbon protein
MNTTQQAISLFQSYVDSQKPLITSLENIIVLLQNDYATRLASGDLKSANDSIVALTTRATTAEAKVTEQEGTITDLTTRAETAEKAVSDAQTVIADLTTRVETA